MTAKRMSFKQSQPHEAVISQATKLFEGLQPPILNQTRGLITGAETDKLRLQNKWRRHTLQEQQVPTTCGLPIRDRHPSHLCRSDHLIIATKCAQLALPRCTQQENYCQNGHNWDAPQKQANLGQKRRCGTQWLQGPTNRPDCLKHLRISQRKVPRK